MQLDYLAQDDPQLKPYFYGTVACERLHKKPDKKTPRANIVNTDPHDRPVQHLLALWTYQNVCEVMDSYVLPLERYEQATSFRDWIVRISFPTTWKDSLETFHHATTRPYGYLVLDLHPASSDHQ